MQLIGQFHGPPTVTFCISQAPLVPAIAASNSAFTNWPSWAFLRLHVAMATAWYPTHAGTKPDPNECFSAEMVLSVDRDKNWECCGDKARMETSMRSIF